MIMNKLNIQHCLERKKELFQKYDIDYIINNSSKIETNDIYDLRLDEKIFNIDENNYYSIFIVIVDKENNNILESRNINKNTKEVRFNGRHAEKFFEWLYSGDETFLSYKYKIYIDFINNYKPIYRLYEAKKIEAIKLFKLGENGMSVSKKLSIPFQTIYKWKKENYEN